MRAPLVVLPASVRRHAREFAARHARLLRAAPLRYGATLAFALGRGRRGLRDFIRAGWLAVQLREDGVEHLHSHFISAPADIAELVSRLSALPFSISAHAKDIYLSDPADLQRKLLAARFTVTGSEVNRQVLATIAPRAPVHRMYHGVDHALFHPTLRAPAPDVPLIVSVGRLRAKKGLDNLIDACALLRRRGQAFACEIVGYGEEQARLQAQIDRLGLAGQVRLLGKLAREQVISRYAHAAAYVQPSRIAADGDRDGIPNVLLEAMAMGLPVVATRVSGIPELVGDGFNGLLVQADEPAALADAITRLLKQPALCADLGCRARDRHRTLRQRPQPAAAVQLAATPTRTRIGTQQHRCADTCGGRMSARMNPVLATTATATATATAARSVMPVNGSVAYVMNGFPRLSETFIAHEIHQLEQSGMRLRLFVVKDEAEDKVHPVVAAIRAPLTYLPKATSLSGASLWAWLRANLPSFWHAHLAIAWRHPLRYARTLSAALALTWRHWPRKVFVKEFLQAGAIADALRRDSDMRHLHGHFCHGVATITWFASRLTGIPFSFTAHAKDIYQAELNPGDLLERKLGAARFVATCTCANATVLSARHPRPEEVHTIYHGLDTDYFSPVPQPAPTDTPLILAVGRFVEKKGFDHLIAACAQLKRDGLRLRCVIVYQPPNSVNAAQ